MKKKARELSGTDVNRLKTRIGWVIDAGILPWIDIWKVEV
jgi:hypothetical protein